MVFATSVTKPVTHVKKRCVSMLKGGGGGGRGASLSLHCRNPNFSQITEDVFGEKNCGVLLISPIAPVSVTKSLTQLGVPQMGVVWKLCTWWLLICESERWFIRPFHVWQNVERQNQQKNRLSEKGKIKVADRHCFDGDPDLTSHFDADSHSDAESNPAPSFTHVGKSEIFLLFCFFTPHCIFLVSFICWCHNIQHWEKWRVNITGFYCCLYSIKKN